MNRYRLKWVGGESGHYVVYKDGRFFGSYDTRAEAQRAIEEDK